LIHPGGFESFRPRAAVVFAMVSDYWSLAEQCCSDLIFVLYFTDCHSSREHGFRIGGIRSAHAVNQEIARPFPPWRTVFPWPFDRLILISVPAAAEVYPVRGVWTSTDTDFSAAANETCIAVKTFGVEAVSKKSISEMIIFAKDKRYDVKGDVQTEATIKSIKVADGGFRITETFTKGARWLGFKIKTTYLLNAIDLQTIEIWDGVVLTIFGDPTQYSLKNRNSPGPAALVEADLLL
jgi:hypothetical protein